MRIVAFEREIFESEVFEIFDLGIEDHARERATLASELFAGLVEVVRVKVEVAEGVDKFPGLESGDLRHHQGEQGIGGDIERNTEKEIRTALVELAAYLPFLHIKLKQSMAWRESHEIEFPRIPCADNQTSAVGVRADLRDDGADLVERGTIRFPPVPPLGAIDASEIAISVRPRVPNRNLVLA